MEAILLVDQFVMMGEELALSLLLQVVLFLSSQTDWKNIVQITKLSMKHFYLACSSWNQWALNMWNLMVIRF